VSENSERAPARVRSATPPPTSALHARQLPGEPTGLPGATATVDSWIAVPDRRPSCLSRECRGALALGPRVRSFSDGALTRLEGILPG
jgi:hypothetical protein